MEMRGPSYAVLGDTNLTEAPLERYTDR